MSKATDFYFGLYIHRVHRNKTPIKIFQKRKRARIQGLPKVFRYPYYLRNSLSYGLLARLVHSQGPSELKAVNNLWQKESWVYPRAAQSFQVPPYYLRNALSYGLLTRLVHSQGPSEQKAVKNCRKRKLSLIHI